MDLCIMSGCKTRCKALKHQAKQDSQGRYVIY